MTGKSISERIGDLGHRLAVEAHAAWLAARDPRVPMLARFLAIAVAAYALSPIDLIPDFIPVLGWLDDLLIVPLGLWTVLRWLPPDVLAAARRRSDALLERPRSRVAAAVIVVVWLAAAALAWQWLA